MIKSVMVPKSVSRKFTSSMESNMDVMFIGTRVLDEVMIFDLDVPEFFEFPDYAKVSL